MLQIISLSCETSIIILVYVGWYAGDVAALGWWDLFINYGYMKYPNLFTVLTVLSVACNNSSVLCLWFSVLQSALRFLFAQSGTILQFIDVLILQQQQHLHRISDLLPGVMVSWYPPTKKIKKTECAVCKTSVGISWKFPWLAFKSSSSCTWRYVGLRNF